MERAEGIFNRAAYSALTWTARGVGRVPPLRHALVGVFERRLRRSSARPDVRHPPAVSADKLAMGLALLRIADRALADDMLGSASFRGLLDRLVYDVLVRKGDQRAKRRFREAHGCGPPDFLTISPGKTCNLQCVGCYANSGPTPEKLDWTTFDRVVSEARDLWGTRFFVISGGEPFAYRDGGQGVLDLARRHPDCFFILYTNGTLINDAVARKLAELGNLSPSLSLEGLRERTDARRGAGVFDKVLAAMERLRREKVFFGVSLTATRDNAEEIFSDQAADLFFDKMGALYAWVFHYMPIGRAPSLDLMMTPEQRVRLHERIWYLVRERRIFIADFWNSGTATNGCVAGGRPGGYFYVNWNGDVCPCVFVPYSPVNIKDVYARGGTLDDIWHEPLFGAFRDWQRNYGYRENGEPYGGRGNWLMPCPIRDHHAEFRVMLERHPAKPTDADAQAALEDPAYAAGLAEFDKRLAELTDPVWRERYLSGAGGKEKPEADAKPRPVPVTAG
jgi:MoaA/NifB/PqqE/SkfB family radical SAM enzyme